MIARVGHIAGQKTADLAAARITDFGNLRSCAMLCHAVAPIGAVAAASTDHVYPSPCRSACASGGPVSRFTGGIGGFPAAIGYHGKTAIEFAGNRVTVVRVSEILTKGRKPCRKNQSSSRPSQPSPCPLALKATPNEPWPVQAQALSLQKCWEPTAQAPCSQVLPLACSVTTSAFAAPSAADRRASSDASPLSDRRRGMTPAAVSRFGGDH